MGEGMSEVYGGGGDDGVNEGRHPVCVMGYRMDSRGVEVVRVCAVKDDDTPPLHPNGYSPGSSACPRSLH